MAASKNAKSFRSTSATASFSAMVSAWNPDAARAARSNSVDCVSRRAPLRMSPSIVTSESEGR